MRTTETVIIGAGQAGLAVSRCLTATGRDHVVLERGQVAERWRSERWDSLRLLTPNWMTRLPDGAYDGPDPDGFMTASELTAHLQRYAVSFAAPVETGVRVIRVTGGDGRYVVDTDRGAWRAANVVVATGAADRPAIPALASRFSGGVHQTDPSRYKRPADLPAGGVLVVGASASGAQIADELARSGRAVTVAVGGHSRVPRCYRGRDVMWWLDRAGVLDDRIDDRRDPDAARRAPSLSLVGRADRADLDLAALIAAGARLVGRLVAVEGSVVTCADDLAATAGAADAQLRRLLARLDHHATVLGYDTDPTIGPPSRPAPFRPDPGPAHIDLGAEGITAVVWATGYRRAYPWLAVPVLDARGEIIQRAGVTPAPGLYVVGLRFQTRRRSSFIDGVGHDARLVADHIVCRAGTTAAA